MNDGEARDVRIVTLMAKPIETLTNGLGHHFLSTTGNRTNV
jgi:hypothetical protein